MGADSDVTCSAEEDFSLKVVLGALAGGGPWVPLRGSRGRKRQNSVVPTDGYFLVLGATGGAVVLLALRAPVLRVTRLAANVTVT